MGSALRELKEIMILIKQYLREFIVFYTPGFLFSFLLLHFFNYNLIPVELTQHSKEIFEIVLFLIVLPFSFGIILHIGTLRLYGWITDKKIIKKKFKIETREGNLPESEAYRNVYRTFFASMSIAFPIFLLVILNRYLSYNIICALIALVVPLIAFIIFFVLTLGLYKDVEKAKKPQNEL